HPASKAFVGLCLPKLLDCEVLFVTYKPCRLYLAGLNGCPRYAQCCAQSRLSGRGAGGNGFGSAGQAAGCDAFLPEVQVCRSLCPYAAGLSRRGAAHAAALAQGSGLWLGLVGACCARPHLVLSRHVLLAAA